MPKWVRLLDVLENPKKYGDISQIPIEYTPIAQMRSIATIRRKPNSTLYLEEEVLVPGYYPVKFKGKAYLVSSEVTLEELSLSNEKKAIRKIQEDAAKYGNKSLKAKGVDWNEERVEILHALPEFLRNIAGWYWTTIPCAKFDAEGRFICGLKLISGGAVHGEDNFGVLSYDGEYFTTSVPVRPLIQLHRNTYVDLECMDGYPLPIKLK